MRNFADAQKVLQTAYNSTNSAIEENARYMESIEAKLNVLQSEYQKFILGDGGLEAFEKKILDIAIALTEFINKIGGLSSVLSALGTILAVAIVPNILKATKSFGDLIGIIPALINHFQYAQKAGVTFTTALSELTVGLNVTQLAIQGIVAAIGIAITAYNIWKQQQEELAEAAHESAISALEQNANIESQIRSLQKENQSREDLIKAIQAVDGAYKDEGQRLDEINKKRQETIDKLKEEGRQALENAEHEGFSQYKKDLKTVKTGYNYDTNTQSKITGLGVDYNTSDLPNTIKTLEEARNKLQALGATTEWYDEEIKRLKAEYDDASQGIDNYNQILLAEGKVYDENTGKIRALLPAEIAHNDSTYESIDAIEKQTGALEELGISLDEVWDKLDESGQDKLLELLTNNDIEGAVELLTQYGIEIANVSEGTEEATDAISKFLGVADDLQSAYETLCKAAAEYNKNGYISGATLKKLAKLQPEYQAQLDASSGSMEVLNGKLQEDFQLQKQLAILQVKLETETAALAYAQSYLAENVQKVGDDSSEAKPKVSELSQAFTDLGHAAQDANKAIWETRAALGDDEDALAKFEEGLAKIYEDGEKRIKTYEGIELEWVDSSSSAASSHKDAWKEAFEEEQRLLKHSLEMNEITEIEYYEKLKDLNEKYFGEISGKHEKYLKEYQENEEEIYKGLKSVYDKVRDYLAKAVENGYEKAIKALQKEEKKVLDDIKKTIEALKKEKSSVLDNIKDEIDSLKKQKENVQKYYNDQIDAIKKENEVLEEQNQLLEYQQALQQAKAQKVMVMQGGKFQLGENESAVAQAEQNLGQYQDQLSYEQQIQQLEDLRDAQVESIEARIESLEEYYDYMEEYYDKQIEAMEEYRDRVQEEYDARIEALQTELDTFKEGLQREEDLEDARLANQVLGINERANLYEQDLANLQNYINSVNAMLAQLGDEGATVSYSYTPLNAYHDKLSSVSAVDAQIATRASGDASFKKDGIALVGESPNTELVLGSRANKLGGGQLLNLSKGSGVVNAESTQTLAGLLNTLAQPQAISNSSRSMQQTFNFGSISLPNVTNAESFVGALRDKFNNYAIQYSTIKR